MDTKQIIAEAIAETGLLTVDEAYPLIEEPPQPELGDFALPCFTLAKKLRNAPQKIAAELIAKLPELDLFRAIEQKGPYINFYLDPEVYVPRVLKELKDEGEDYGKQELGNNESVIVEYSSANIAKPFHVGHGYSTVLGQVIANLYEALGYDVHRFNHLGDYGTQFGKLISAWKRWGNQEALDENPIKELTRVYVKFHAEMENNPELEDEGRLYFKRLEDGEPEEVALWEKFREVSLEAFNKIYDRMNIHFDNYNGEAFYSQFTEDVVEDLRSQGLLEESEGAQVVRLDEEGLNPCIILKSDGTSIYATRDLAAIDWRKKHYDFKKNIYIVGNEQTNHFNQLFAVLKKEGKEAADQCVHVSFGRIKFADGDFSTRKGNIITLESLLDKAVEKTKEIIEENAETVDIEDVDQTAETIGVDAVIFTYIKNGRERDIFFSWEDTLSFEGESAPYLLYSYARARSILRKSGRDWHEIPTERLELLTSPEDLDLAKLIDQYPAKIRQAAEAFEPAILVRHILNLARSFNHYYHQKSILKAETEELVEARLLLTGLTSELLKNMLELIGLKTVERM